MATELNLEHLTAFEDNDKLSELKDRTPEDRIDFRLLYDPQVVNPWSDGSNEITRLYFTAERLDGFYVPINFPEQLDEETRSTPIGRPATDTNGENSWDDAGGGDYRIEEGLEMDGREFDVMWLHESDDSDELPIIAAEIDETAA